MLIFNLNEISCLEPETLNNVSAVYYQEPLLTRDEIAINLAARIILTSGIALVGSLLVGQVFIGLIPVGIYYILVPLTAGIPSKVNTIYL
jgi:hypothetical protein